MATIFDHQPEMFSQCTGTVVAPRLVLTAAHCAENTETAAIASPSGFEVGTGDVDWAATGEQVSSVSRVIVYGGFNRATLTGDAALLELSTPTSAPAIGLATSLAGMPSGTEAVIAGWGNTFYGQETSTEWLRWAETVVQGPSYCEGSASYIGEPFNSERELCTIDPPNYSTGFCHGDSGGPLLTEWPNGQQLVEIGVISHMQAECSTEHPDVYTRSDLIASWVNEWASVLKRREEEAAAAANKRQEEQETAAAAAKKRQEEEAAAATNAAAKKRQEEQLAAAAKKRQEEQASAAAAARKRQEEEGGVYRGGTSQSQEPIALVVGSGGRRLTALSTTFVYRCRGGHTFSEEWEALSNHDPERLSANHGFSGTFDGNPRAIIKGTFNTQAGTAIGTLTATYVTRRYGRCSTGRVTWSASRSPAQPVTPGTYNGSVEPNQRIALRIAPDGKSIVALHLSARFKCPRGHSLHPTEWFLSTSDSQALESFGTFTMYLTESGRYSARMDGEIGMIPGRAYGTLEASIKSRWGRCRTGLVWWQAMLRA